MDRTQFEREKERGAAFAIASRLLHRGLITEEEHQKLTVALASKYCQTVSPGGSPLPQKKIRRNHQREEV